MELTFSPIRGDAPLTLIRDGDALIVNGEVFDFATLRDGDTLPREAVGGVWLAGDVTRIEGELHIAVALPHGPDAPTETRFPAPINVAEDGPIGLPPYDAPGAQT